MGGIPIRLSRELGKPLNSLEIEDKLKSVSLEGRGGNHKTRGRRRMAHAPEDEREQRLQGRLEATGWKDCKGVYIRLWDNN